MKTEKNPQQEPWFKKAMAKDMKARPDYKACKHGHDMRDAANVHVGDLRRTGKRTCKVCWQASSEKYLAKAKKASVPAATHVAKPLPVRRARPVRRKEQTRLVAGVLIPNDPDTALKVCLRFVDVETSKLKMDEQAQAQFGRRLLGSLATHFGVYDFQARRPVLVLDTQRALPHVMQSAQA